MREQIPKEIDQILRKAYDGTEPTKTEKDKVRTYLSSLEKSVHHPVTGKEIPNPVPIEVDVSLKRPECLEDRVKRIMSVSSRIAQMKGYETAEEADDFDIDDVFDQPMPRSPFEMVDHFQDMEPEQPGAPVADPADIPEGTTPSSEGDQPTAPPDMEPAPVVPTE